MKNWRQWVAAFGAAAMLAGGPGSATLAVYAAESVPGAVESVEGETPIEVEIPSVTETTESVETPVALESDGELDDEDYAAEVFGDAQERIVEEAVEEPLEISENTDQTDVVRNETIEIVDAGAEQEDTVTEDAATDVESAEADEDIIATEGDAADEVTSDDAASFQEEIADDAETEIVTEDVSAAEAVGDAEIAIDVVSDEIAALNASSTSYDGAAGASWGINNYKTSSGLCAEFVSNCLKNGGYTAAWSTGCTTLRSQMLNSGAFTEYAVYVSTSNQRLLNTGSNAGKIAVGDVVMWHLKGSSTYEHAALIYQIDSNGIVHSVQRNPAAINDYHILNSLNKNNQEVVVLHYTGGGSSGGSSTTTDNCSVAYKGYYTVKVDALSINSEHNFTSGTGYVYEKGAKIYIYKASGTGKGQIGHVYVSNLKKYCYVAMNCLTLVEHVHTYDSGVITTQPTCTDSGIKIFTCAAGDDSYTVQMSPLGHDWTSSYGSDTTSHWRTCTRCGEKSIAAHAASDWIVDQAATTTASGSRHKACTVCGYIMQTETIPATGSTSKYTGWKTEGGKDYWYENGVKQGTTGRGKEIYDPGTKAWYWLDAVQGGAKAVSKDVYQESNGGKWVRYDANGHMIKGWQTTSAGTYYFDLVTGAMAKGKVTIDNLPCWFDENTGIGKHLVWEQVNGQDYYWYENGKRQGYDPGDKSYRGKEIYDPAQNAWFWLDNNATGKKAVSKDVYQPYTYQGKDTIGKWVRYDATGRMIKGWQTTSKGTYYFDPTTGAMTKGSRTIDGKTYYFDPTTGICK